MLTAIIFLAVLAVLIFVHELGHFLFARWCGIRVDAFALGFGPKIFSWRRGETTYGLNLIPFGGYVKIFGENPDDESLSGPDSKRSFVNKPRIQQIIVLAAGVFFNFIFAWILYVIIFTSGITASTNSFEKYSDHFSNQRIVISEVVSGSPASEAGLKVGDTIANVYIKNPPVDNIQTVEEIQNSINDTKGSPITFEYMRNKEIKKVSVYPINGLVKDKYAIGIAMSDVVDIHIPFFNALYEGLRYTLIMIKETSIGLYSFIVNIFQGTADFSQVSGPIGIAGIVGGAATLGFTYLLMITALISINLGVINLLPFPALDGGRILFVVIESIIRRRISYKFTNVVNAVGFALLMILMILVTYKDVVKLWR